MANWSGAMCQYSSIQERVARPLAILSIACFILAGCHKRPQQSHIAPDPIVQIVAAGYDAYRAGDQTTLDGDIQALAARLPADETAGTFVSCTSQGFAMRRVERAKRKLEYLDNPTVLAMGEVEQFVFFQQLVEEQFHWLDSQGRLADQPADVQGPADAVEGPTDFECETAPGFADSHTADLRQHDAIQRAGYARLRVWLNDLHQSLDTQFDTRLQNGAQELYDAQLRPLWPQWTPPSDLALNASPACKPAQQAPTLTRAHSRSWWFW